MFLFRFCMCGVTLKDAKHAKKMPNGCLATTILSILCFKIKDIHFDMNQRKERSALHLGEICIRVSHKTAHSTKKKTKRGEKK